MQSCGVDPRLCPRTDEKLMQTTLNAHRAMPVLAEPQPPERYVGMTPHMQVHKAGQSLGAQPRGVEQAHEQSALAQGGGSPKRGALQRGRSVAMHPPMGDTGTPAPGSRFNRAGGTPPGAGTGQGLQTRAVPRSTGPPCAEQSSLPALLSPKVREQVQCKCRRVGSSRKPCLPDGSAEPGGGRAHLVPPVWQPGGS